MTDYTLKIDFTKDSPNPARVFRSMAGLVDSFGRFDRDFFESIDLQMIPSLVLHDVEKGSLKAILRWILELPDREALRDGDIKKLLGRVVDDARTYLLRKLEKEPTIAEKSQLLTFQKDLTEIATTIPTNLIHIPKPIPLPRLLTTIQSFESSTRVLFKEDSATYATEYHERTISSEIFVAPALQDELLETISIQHPTRVQLPVKKPDLIGDSQWDLYMGNRVVRAKILDGKWLGKFHARVIDLMPGDALDALLEITLLQTSDGEVVGYKYQVLEVYGVVPRTHFTQLDLPENSE